MPLSPTVGRYMTRSPVVVERTATMAYALGVMEQHGFRHLPVMAAGKLVGVVSERELKIVENMRGVDSGMCVVGDFLLGAPYTVTPETPLRRVAQEMADHKIGSAVVVDGEAVVGVFTTTDALRALSSVLSGGPVTGA
jgi:acetoin utilization protein AcuB